MDIEDLEYLAKGKRGRVFVGKLKNKKICVKVSSRAKIEAKWLKILNKYKIGPKLIKVKDDLMVYEFVSGKRIGECLNKRVIEKVFDQCRILDKLKINKKELVNPYKHILVEKSKVVMIDFERCHKVKKPKNVTQFGEYLMRQKIVNREKFTPLLKKYKEKQSEENFKMILAMIV